MGAVDHNCCLTYTSEHRPLDMDNQQARDRRELTARMRG